MQCGPAALGPRHGRNRAPGAVVVGIDPSKATKTAYRWGRSGGGAQGWAVEDPEGGFWSRDALAC